MVLNKSGDKAARCSFAGGILGILSLILLNPPFVPIIHSLALGPSITPTSGDIILLASAWLMAAGGMTAAVTGFILYHRLMHGGVSSSIFSSRKAAKLMIFSGVFIIVGTIGILDLSIGDLFGWYVGWGVFAELLIGLVIVVLASVTLTSILRRGQIRDDDES